MERKLMTEEQIREFDRRTAPPPQKLEPVDMVNHPPHYTLHPSGVECIQITEHMNFNIGNAMKYLWRVDLKGDSIENLEKVVWYAQREIQRRRKLHDVQP